MVTKEKFIEGWLERSEMTEKEMEEVGLEAVSCTDCDLDGCEGWRMRSTGVDNFLEKKADELIKELKG